jgi:ATP-binding cassette subfamily F protein 3
LGSFLFSGDDVFKSVSVLSGGEKSRLALAKMLLQPVNLIVLDEPTNHLDMRSKAVLQEALDAFEGSFVIVSHDRDFLDPLVTKVVEFRGGHLKQYLGNISDYIDAKQRETDQVSRPPAGGKPTAAQAEKERKRQEAVLRQQRYERTKPVRDAIAKLERAIEEGERRKTELEHEMTAPELYKQGEHVREIREEHRKVETNLAYAYDRWSALNAELEQLSNLNYAGPPHSGRRRR